MSSDNYTNSCLCDAFSVKLSLMYCRVWCHNLVTQPPSLAPSHPSPHRWWLVRKTHTNTHDLMYDREHPLSVLLWNLMGSDTLDQAVTCQLYHLAPPSPHQINMHRYSVRFTLEFTISWVFLNPVWYKQTFHWVVWWNLNIIC